MTEIKRIKRLTTSTVVSYAVLQPTVSKSRSSATTFTLLVVSFYLISTMPRAFPCVPDMEEVCSSSTSSPPRRGHFRVFQTWKKCVPVLPHLHHAADISVCSRHGRSVFQFYLISTTAWTRGHSCVPHMVEVCSCSTSSSPHSQSRCSTLCTSPSPREIRPSPTPRPAPPTPPGVARSPGEIRPSPTPRPAPPTPPGVDSSSTRTYGRLSRKSVCRTTPATSPSSRHRDLLRNCRTTWRGGLIVNYSKCCRLFVVVSYLRRGSDVADLLCKPYTLLCIRDGVGAHARCVQV